LIFKLFVSSREVNSQLTIPETLHEDLIFRLRGNFFVRQAAEGKHD